MISKKDNKECPICGKASSAENTPFCSKRCADIDLGRWFRGDYAVPLLENDDEPENDSENNS